MRISPVPVAPGVKLGGPRPVMIAGPCVIESKAHLLKMARAGRRRLEAELLLIFKASFDKANRPASPATAAPASKTAGHAC